MTHVCPRARGPCVTGGGCYGVVGRSQDRAARCDFHGGNAPCVEHQKPIAVPAAQHAGIFRKRGDDVVDNLVFAARTGLLVRQIQVVTADEPNTKHDGCHVHAQ